MKNIKEDEEEISRFSLTPLQQGQRGFDLVLVRAARKSGK